MERENIKLDIEKLIGEVRSKYDVSISPNDPILAASLLNEVFLEHAIDILTEKNEIHQQEISQALKEGIEEAKSTASEIITQAGHFVLEMAKEGVQESTQVVQNAIANANSKNAAKEPDTNVSVVLNSDIKSDIKEGIKLMKKSYLSVILTAIGTFFAIIFMLIYLAARFFASK